MDLKKMENMLQDDEDEEKPEPDDEDEDEDSEIEDESFFQQHKKKIFVGIGIAVVAIGIIIFANTRPETYVPAPPPPPPPPTVDPWENLREIHEAGIGAYWLDEARIFEQGNIESLTFRQDFSQVDQPEMFALPIRIDTARDNMAFTRHRAVTAPGVEVYWLEGDFRGRRIVTTIPYALYQLLPPSGIVAVDVEVVTDANGAITITYVRPLPPAGLQGR